MKLSSHLKLRFNQAGLITIAWSKIPDECHYKDWALHFFVKPQYWKVGHSYDDYDSVLEYFGWGPFFLLAIVNI